MARAVQKASDEARYVVEKHATLEAAMAQIEENNHRSVIVVDDDRVVVGTLSDGDIRKALLDHRLLSTPVHQVMNLNFLALKPEDAHRAKAIFDQEHIFLIPVVDDEGHLVEILRAY